MRRGGAGVAGEAPDGGARNPLLSLAGPALWRVCLVQSLGTGQENVFAPRTGAHMARGDVRVAATLACEVCKRRNYQTKKNKRNTPDRLTISKYCRWCRTHTSHKETR